MTSTGGGPAHIPPTGKRRNRQSRNVLLGLQVRAGSTTIEEEGGEKNGKNMCLHRDIHEHCKIRP